MCCARRRPCGHLEPISRAMAQIGWSAGRGIGGLTEPADILDMGNSGTAARLLAGILATHDFYSVMTGDASLRKRPMRRVIEPLRGTGAEFFARAGGRLPLTIRGRARCVAGELPPARWPRRR